MLSKIGAQGPLPNLARRPLHSRLLSKIGEPPPPTGPGMARLLSKIGEGPAQRASLVARLLRRIGGEGTELVYVADAAYALGEGYLEPVR